MSDRTGRRVAATRLSTPTGESPVRSTMIITAVVVAIALAGCGSAERARSSLYVPDRLNTLGSETESASRFASKDSVYETFLFAGEDLKSARVTRIIGPDILTAEVFADRPLRVWFGHLAPEGQGLNAQVAYELRVVDGKLVADLVADPEPAKTKPQSTTK